jgi:hypothetical protein
MHSKEAIEKTIREAVKDVTGIAFLEKDASLIDRELDIIPANFLYIFDILEEKLQLPIHDVLINHTFEVMTVENLTDALFKLELRGYTE